MMTSSKWKILVRILVEHCLSYNISKFGRKSITGKRDNLNWTKEKMTSSMKMTFFFFFFRCKHDDFISFVGARVVWNCISNSCSFQPWYKFGGHCPFWRAISISKMAWFWANLHYIAHSSTRRFSTLTRAHGLMKGQEWLKWMEINNYSIRNPNHVKTLNIYLSCALCARGHVRTGNFEMLKMTQFVLSFVQKVILSNFKFWRARHAAHADMNCQYVDPWPEVYVYWIWWIFDEWLWRYEW